MLKRIKFIVIGLMFIVLGLSICMGIEYKKYQIKVEEKKGVACYLKGEESKYIAVLEMPKINFKRGLTNEYNIDKNISFIKDSDMPDIQNSTTIIAGHSGNNSTSYFKNLYKLKIGDYAYLIYNNKSYKYKIYDIKEIDKTGKLKLKKEKYNRLILVTCKGKNKQLIIYFKLTKKEAI